MSELLASHIFKYGQKLELRLGDLTEEEVDAIVNAANSLLKHGGGIAGAIVKKGGDQIQVESDAWVKVHGKVSHAIPAFTGSGSLPCKYILHAVGPIWGDGDEDRKLAQAISGSLYLANELQLSSIAFPAISTGIFGFPTERAAQIFYQTFADHFDRDKINTIKIVRLVLFDKPTLSAFHKIYEFWNNERSE